MRKWVAIALLLTLVAFAQATTVATAGNTWMSKFFQNEFLRDKVKMYEFVKGDVVHFHLKQVARYCGPAVRLVGTTRLRNKRAAKEKLK